ncbi:hypothetical protein QFC19_001063 [Naganishia cerealis]|uniref:Uncharacterized protein n=1 Tax=Naganishia cerealis TaxID=610337 RepID=A0ACC2WJQ2_9TREE|nr:hypothetical protein QFC19_001063 [Naganishia cerealis]
MSNGPVFEIICLGAGGGPLEGDVLGYMCKPYASGWDQGWIGLEGGCGIGALTALLHQALLTKALRELHQASALNSQADTRSQSRTQQRDAEGTIEQEVALPTPPTSAHVNAGTRIGDTVNSIPPAMVANLGRTGHEEVHVEEETLFPGLRWPEDYQTPVLKAAWLFSHLTSYLITHAHFDHTLSLVLSTGSLPNPPSPAIYDPLVNDRTYPSTHSGRRPIYASLSTLEKLQKVYHGDVWPELGCWSDPFPIDNRKSGMTDETILIETDLVMAQTTLESSTGRITSSGMQHHLAASALGKPQRIHDTDIPRRKSSLLTTLNEAVKGKSRPWKQRPNAGGAGESGVDQEVASSSKDSMKRNSPLEERTLHEIQPAYELKPGVGVQYCPTPAYPISQKLPLRSAKSGVNGNDLVMSVLELPISHGSTTQGNYEASAFFIRVAARQPEGHGVKPNSAQEFAEILFFGDVESSYTGEVAKALNTRVWRAAAERWAKGTLRAIFIECSYPESRPKHLMFGHLGPSDLLGELEIMASYLPKGTTPPLQGLSIYIQHVKEPLVPEEPIKQKITRELEELEAERKLGVQFLCLARGMRVTI